MLHIENPMTQDKSRIPLPNRFEGFSQKFLPLQIGPLPEQEPKNSLKPITSLQTENLL